MLLYPFICLPFQYMEGIVFICNIDVYCVKVIFNGTGDMLNRWHFYTLNTNWDNKSSLTFTPNMHVPFQPFNNTQHTIVTTKSNEQRGVNLVVSMDISIWRDVSKVYLLFPDAAFHVDIFYNDTFNVDLQMTLKFTLTCWSCIADPMVGRLR